MSNCHIFVTKYKANDNAISLYFVFSANLHQHQHANMLTANMVNMLAARPHCPCVHFSMLMLAFSSIPVTELLAWPPFFYFLRHNASTMNFLICVSQRQQAAWLESTASHCTVVGFSSTSILLAGLSVLFWVLTVPTAPLGPWRAPLTTATPAMETNPSMEWPFWVV